MSMTVLPLIEVENPFGAIMNTLAKDVMPFVQALAVNKEKIAQLSNAELPDYVPVLKQYAPDLLTQDGKIDWDKVNEYATSGDAFKQKIANVLSVAKKQREEYAKQPLVIKLSTINDVATATDPNILRKIGASNQALQKLKDVVNNTNLPDEVKYVLLLNADKFVEKPEYVELLDSIISGKKKQETTQQGGGTGSWRFSLDGSKPFGIKLEEPQLTPPQITPPQIPKTVKQGTVKPTGQKDNKQQKKQETNPQDIKKVYIDGVEYTVKPKKGGGYEVLSVKEIPLQEPLFLDPINWLGRFFGNVDPINWLGRIFGNVDSKFVSRLIGRGGTKVAKKGAENVAKETAENVVSTQAETKAQSVVEQASKYNERRKQVAERIKKQMEETKGLRGEIVDYTPPQFERILIREYAKKTREKKLPVLAPKETGWEFANAKPPALVPREGRIVDYIPPQFERIPVAKYSELIRQKKLSVPAPKDTQIIPVPKETPYKETVAREGFKTTKMLEEFLKREKPKVETKETVLKPIKNLRELVKEIPDEAKNDPEIRRRFVEITRDLKKISEKAPFKDVSDDLRVLDAKVNELKDLLRKLYSKTKTASEKPSPKFKPKKKKSDE